MLGLCLWRRGERVGSSTSNRGVSPLQREGGHGGFRVQKEVLLSSPLPFSQEEIYLHSLRPPLGLVFLVGIAFSVCSTILSSDCMMNIFSWSFSVNYALGKDFIWSFEVYDEYISLSFLLNCSLGRDFFWSFNMFSRWSYLVLVVVQNNYFLLGLNLIGAFHVRN